MLNGVGTHRAEYRQHAENGDLDLCAARVRVVEGARAVAPFKVWRRRPAVSRPIELPRCLRSLSISLLVIGVGERAGNICAGRRIYE